MASQNDKNPPAQTPDPSPAPPAATPAKPNLRNLTASPRIFWKCPDPNGQGGIVMPFQVVKIPDHPEAVQALQNAYERGHLKGVAELTTDPAQTLAEWEAAESRRTNPRGLPG